MKVIAKTSCFDGRGHLKKKGDEFEIETTSFNPLFMTEIPEVKKVAKVAEAKKKVSRKTTTKKKG